VAHLAGWQGWVLFCFSIFWLAACKIFSRIPIDIMAGELQLFADGPRYRPFLDFAMARDDWQSCATQGSTKAVAAPSRYKNATVEPQMAFPIREFHASAIRKPRARRAGKELFSASSRWHCTASLSGVRKICFGLFDGFALRNRGRNLLNEAGIAPLFGGFKNGCQFHSCRLSHPSMTGRFAEWTTGSSSSLF